MSFYSPQYYFPPSQCMGSATPAASGAMSRGNFTSSSATTGESMNMQMKEQIKVLRTKYSETQMELDRCKQEQETFSVNYHTFMEKSAKQEQISKQVKIALCSSNDVTVALSFSFICSWVKKIPTLCSTRKTWTK